VTIKVSIFAVLLALPLFGQRGPKITVVPAPKDPFKLQQTTSYPWKKSITATVFWIGEKPTQNNPTPNNKSSWDVNWQKNYGGFDNPTQKPASDTYPVASPRGKILSMSLCLTMTA